jgi:hypothetical protein
MRRSVVIAGFATAALLLSAVAESGPGLARQMTLAFEEACQGDKPYGDVEYADPGYQDDKKKRYPIDTEKHIRAAWSYISKPRNAGKYSADELKRIKDKIIAAWKDKIDPEGPPSAAPPR